MDKDFLIMQVDERIRLTKALIRDLQKAIEVINTFNNKVYNKRLVAAIQEKIENDIYTDSSFKNRLMLRQRRGNELIYGKRSYYLERRDVYLFIALSENRINLEKTARNIQSAIEQELKRVEELKQAVLLYDKEKQEREHIKQLAKQYENKYPNFIRGLFVYTEYKYEI